MIADLVAEHLDIIEHVPPVLLACFVGASPDAPAVVLTRSARMLDFSAEDETWHRIGAKRRDRVYEVARVGV